MGGGDGRLDAEDPRYKNTTNNCKYTIIVNLIFLNEIDPYFYI